MNRVLVLFCLIFSVSVFSLDYESEQYVLKGDNAHLGHTIIIRKQCDIHVSKYNKMTSNEAKREVSFIGSVVFQIEKKTFKASRLFISQAESGCKYESTNTVLKIK